MVLSLALQADPWTDREVITESAFLALGVADIALTHYGLVRGASKMGSSAEGNPLIGKHPSPGKLWGLGLTALASHAVISHFLPHTWRQIWISGGIAVEGTMVVGNVVFLVKF
jgi:hypothetical protein